MSRDIFSYDDFFKPENRFYPIYSWMWNEALDKAEIKNQLDSMYKRNIRGFYVIPLPREFRPSSMTTDLKPPYLSDGYFDMLSFTADYASSKGMIMWLYDEGGWPSGNANGYVTKSNKSLKLKYIENGRVKAGNKADLTNIKATERFIALTHESHKEKLGESFKRLAPLVFTDEPDIKALPFTKSIKKEYKKRTGKRLSSNKLKKHNDPLFNITYHDICADLFAKSYFMPIKKWCNENNMLSAGHLDKDNEAYGFKKSFHHPLRQLRLLDVPGIDVIWGQINPYEDCGFFPRLASSAAEQSGSGLSLTESFSVYGTLTFDRMRYILGYQLVRGINVFNFMLLMYDENGYYAVRQRPAFSEKLPGAEHLPEFNRYMASLQYLMQQGKPATDCALYLPMRSLWADDKDTQSALCNYEKTGKSIERNHGQFDIIDDDLILDCNEEKLHKGLLSMGRAEYKTVYIPAFKYMPEKVKHRLEVFKSNGGNIYCGKNVRFHPTIGICGDCGQLRVHKRKYNNCEIYLVFNESADKIKAEISLPEGASELDILNKRVYCANKVYCFESGEIKIFVADGNNTIKEKAPVQGKKICTLTDFKIKMLKKFTLSKEGMNYTDTVSREKNAESGDLAASFGKEFSGKCEYKAAFSLEGDARNLLISLGNVRYSCEIIFNGVKIAELFMPPYKVIVDKMLVKQNNELIINVSNTAANAFVNFDLPGEWEKKHIGPYHEKALKFEKELLHGGLFGPVEIYEKEKENE